jgi:hypothetical protein
MQHCRSKTIIKQFQLTFETSQLRHKENSAALQYPLHEVTLPRAIGRNAKDTYWNLSYEYDLIFQPLDRKYVLRYIAKFLQFQNDCC